MKLPHPTLPKTKLNSPALFLSLALACLLIIMAVSQLMTYEKFVPIMQNYQLFDDHAFGRVIAALLVVGEIFSLPYLLRMAVSPLLRYTSALSLLLVSSTWLGLGVWATIAQSPLIGLGVFGSLLKQGTPNILVLFGVGLVVVSVIVMWQLRHDFHAK